MHSTRPVAPPRPAKTSGGEALTGSRWALDPPRPECPPTGLSAQLPEGSAQFLGEQLRLLPGGEVAAAVDLVPVDEVAEGSLAPAARCAVDLGGEDGHGDRHPRDRYGVERAAARLRPLPVRTGGRRTGVGEPVERDRGQDLVIGEDLL